MIKPVSLQGNYTMVWSLDPSLDLPEYADDPQLDDAANKLAREKVERERARLLRIARQTGNWTEITKPGEHPTYFTFGHLTHNEFSWIGGEIQRKGMGGHEANDLFFLVAIRQIENFGDVKVGRHRAAQIEGTRDHIWKASPDVLDKLHAALSSAGLRDGAALMLEEFVQEIVRRARGEIDPL